MKYFLYLALFVALLFGSGRLYYRLTDGFRMSNVTMEIPNRSQWQTRALTATEKELVEEALNQPYHYLDKGHQAYVFVSEDDQFVLKLLKFQRVRIPEWLRKTRLPFSLEEWRQKRIEKKDRMLQSLLMSWKLAFDELKKEAAIIYVQIHPSFHFGKKLTLTDKIGFSHELDLDQAIFLVQRKVPLLGPVLDALVEKGQLEEAKALLDRVIALFVSEYQRGLAEKELFILRNTGVFEGKPIHIDTGRFEWDQTLSKRENYSRELQRKTVNLRKWLRTQHPALGDYFEQQVGKV